MTRCLGDRALIRLSEDAGRPAERAHLGACPACANRMQALARDVALVATVLRDEPPPRPAPAVTVPVAWWLPAAALLAGVLMVATWRVPRDPVGTDAPLSLAEVTEATFAIDDAPGLERTDLVALEDVLDGGSPDEGEEQWP